MFDFSSLTNMFSHSEKGVFSHASGQKTDFVKALETTGLEPSGLTGLSRKDIKTLLSNYGIDPLNFLGSHSDELINTIRMSE